MCEFRPKMNYEELGGYVVEHIDKYLPEKYRGKVGTRVVTKNNGVELHGVYLECKEESDKENIVCCPTVYLESYDLDWPETICENVAVALLEAMKMKTSLPEVSRELVLKGARLFVANNEKNAINLSYEFEDLIEGVKAFFDIEDASASVLITKEVASMLNISEEELYEAAKQNTVADASIIDLNSLVFEIMTGNLVEALNFAELDAEEIENLKVDSGVPEMLVVTGKRYQTAATILCDEVQEKLSKVFDERDYLVLPSSIHESIVASARLMDIMGLDKIKDMVSSINDSCLLEQEVFADSVYRYSKGRGLHIVEE